MKRPGLVQAVFAVDSFVAAMLALSVAFLVGLQRPTWALITVYLVSQPLAGAVRSKGVYRILGTLLGGACTLVLVPNLVDAPELLSLALAAWVGLCVYVSHLDRTPRSYAFLLAGYTAAIIGFPAVDAPGAIFDVVLARVEEIGLGIVCATVVHSVVFPRAVTSVLQARVDGFLGDAERWALDALEGRHDVQERRDRRALAADVAELRGLSTHLPFDTARLRPTSRAVQALQGRMTLLLPVLASVEDRLDALRAEGPLEPPLEALLERLRAWVHAGPGASAAEASALLQACAALAPPLGHASSWRDVLTASLATRLADFVEALQDCRALRAWMRRPVGRVPEALAPLLDAAEEHPQHRDHAQAALNAVAVAVGVLGCCVFWIATAWPLGASAALTAALFGSLFASLDNPVPALLSAMWATLAGFVVAGLYLFLVLPRLDGFPMLALALAPTFLGMGALLGHPRWASLASPFSLALLGALGLEERFTAVDLATFLSSALAQAFGFMAAIVAMRFLRRLSTDAAVHRIRRKGWQELAELALPGAEADRSACVGRMVDRLALLAPRLAQAQVRGPGGAAGAVHALRLGLNVVDLQHARAAVPPAAGRALEQLLLHVSGHFGALSEGRDAPLPGALLGELDTVLAHLAGAAPTPAQRSGVVALASLRRGLFPSAAAYLPPSPVVSA